MGLRAYEVLFRFNQGINQALDLSIVEKLELASPEAVSKVRNKIGELRSQANSHFASKIAQKAREGENNLYRVRRNREKAEEGPNEIYLELKSREELRREQGSAPRAVILPWTQADDDCILAMQRPRPSRSRHNPNRVTANRQKGGTPT